jgi:predicted metal-binding membrane protein
MSISTSIPRTARLGRSHRLVLVAALVVVIAVVAWAIASNVSRSSNRQVRTGAPTQASVLGALTPQERQYVVGIVSLTPAQLRAALGTEPSGSRSAPTSLTANERGYARAISSMSPSQLAAAFGTGGERHWR